MTKVTQIQMYGPEQKYQRVAIPARVSDALDVGKGDAVSWSVLDQHSAVIRVVRD